MYKIVMVWLCFSSAFITYNPWSLASPIDDILQIGIFNNLAQAMNTEKPQNNAAYDFIIVGAGAAGCTLANRLSENPNWTVYLLEAGGVENIAHRTPVLAGYLQSTHSNWNYKTVPQKRACFGMTNNECAVPRGKVLGGTSSINYMIYNRGNRRDFDRWAEYGAKGWSYDEVLPYFLRSESANLDGLETTVYHNTTGPLSVEYVKFRTRIADAYVRGAQQAGHASIDYNGESQMGVSYVQATTLNGKRDSAFTSYIEPIQRSRKNLRILTFARVTKILIEPETKTAYGVEFLYRKKKYTIKARKEVILSAGTFNSPQLLMLSGIGPSDNLNAIGLPIIKELPVGLRLYDHMSHFGPTFVTNTTGQTLFPDRSSIRDIFKHILLDDPTTSLSSIGGVEALTFLKVPRSTEPADLPDVEIITVLGSFASDDGTGLKLGTNLRDDVYQKVFADLSRSRRDHFSFLIMQFHPKSFGRVYLRDRNPLSWPVIDPKYFIDDEDVEVLVEGIKESLKIAEMPAMKRIGTKLHTIPVPGCEQYQFASDDYWRCSVRTLSCTLHHQVATCRMGSENDPTTVVNSQLKVHGIHKLRVVDTSIIPFPPTAHTNAAAYMIGEKAADMIRNEWFQQF